MITKIISGVLIAITAFLSFSHGWSGVTTKADAIKMFNDLGMERSAVVAVGWLSLAVGLLILFPQTFFIANIVNALIIVFIMIAALKVGNIRMALIEIPFLLMPLVLIYLGHPLKNN